MARRITARAYTLRAITVVMKPMNPTPTPKTIACRDPDSSARALRIGGFMLRERSIEWKIPPSDSEIERAASPPYKYLRHKLLSCPLTRIASASQSSALTRLLRSTCLEQKECPVRHRQGSLTALYVASSRLDRSLPN